MGEPGAIVRQRQRFRDPKGVEYLVEEERARVPSVGSVLAFYKNGKPLGPAFTDVHAEQYFPAASLYRAACLTFNFGPSFAFPPPDLEVDAYSPVATTINPTYWASLPLTTADCTWARCCPVKFHEVVLTLSFSHQPTMCSL
jgi:hypothetical protein